MTAIGTKQTFQSQPCPLVGLTGHQVLGPPCLLLLTKADIPNVGVNTYRQWRFAS